MRPSDARSSDCSRPKPASAIESPGKVALSSGNTARFSPDVTSPGVVTNVSTLPETLTILLPSILLIAARLLVSATRATVDNDISDPSESRIRALKKSVVLLRSDSGYLTITFSSFLPRCMRCTSCPKTLERIWRATSSGDSPAAIPAGVSSISYCRLPALSESCI